MELQSIKVSKAVHRLMKQHSQKTGLKVQAIADQAIAAYLKQSGGKPA